MPGESGLKVLEEMKTHGIEGNIIISNKNSIDDKVLRLNLSADDYLTKPFHFSELHTRIKAVLRRKQLDGKEVLKLKNLSIDFNQRLAFVNNIEL